MSAVDVFHFVSAESNSFQNFHFQLHFDNFVVAAAAADDDNDDNYVAAARCYDCWTIQSCHEGPLLLYYHGYLHYLNYF
jgi:hypothetical protein